MKHLLALPIVLASLIACSGSSEYSSETDSTKTQKHITPSKQNLDNKNILNAHNKARKQEGVANLIWSDTLEKYAAEWAEYLKLNNKCDLLHRPHTGPNKQKYGENLFYSGSEKWPSGKKTQQKLSEQLVVDKWVSEKNNYDITSNTCKAGSVCGHYKQVVWKKSTQLGCAAAACTNQAQIIVCNYDPVGKFIGQRPF